MAALLSLALLLRHWWARPTLAATLEQAVQRTLADGIATPDLGGDATTAAFCDAVLARLDPDRLDLD
ncbi:Homoisocitrate dehydrogenase [compost metagenome]